MTSQFFAMSMAISVVCLLIHFIFVSFSPCQRCMAISLVRFSWASNLRGYFEDPVFGLNPPCSIAIDTSIAPVFNVRISLLIWFCGI